VTAGSGPTNPTNPTSPSGSTDPSGPFDSTGPTGPSDPIGPTGPTSTGGPGRPVRIAVIGCGAIGSLYAAHLARVPGTEVWAVDPWAEHVAAMESGGLRVTGLGDFVARVHARTDGGQLPACDFGLVATKALDTRAAGAAGHPRQHRHGGLDRGARRRAV
jgi:hypothetical protein